MFYHFLETCKRIKTILKKVKKSNLVLFYPNRELAGKCSSDVNTELACDSGCSINRTHTDVIFEQMQIIYFFH